MTLIALAEQSDLIGKVGQWMLNKPAWTGTAWNVTTWAGN